MRRERILSEVTRMRAEVKQIRERRALADLRPGVSGLLLDGLGGGRLVKVASGRGVQGMLADARAATEHLVDPWNTA